MKQSSSCSRGNTHVHIQTLNAGRQATMQYKQEQQDHSPQYTQASRKCEITHS